MPELPEVDAAREIIHEYFAGKRIISAHASSDEKVLVGVSPEELQKALAGRVLLQPRRKGKHLWFELSDQGDLPIFHLGMTGAFEIRGANVVKYKKAHKKDDSWPPKWCKVHMEFEDGGALAFSDSRRFARIRTAAKPEEAQPISELGLDAFYELPDPEALTALMIGLNRPIKAVLLDQAVLCGIGNWIADEVLYQARIHPESRAGALSKDDYLRLHSSIRDVLALAVSVRADSSMFPETWLFHVRWDKKPGSIGGHKITFLTVGGRTSAVVPAVQKVVTGGAKRGAKKARAATGEEEEGDGNQKPKRSRGTGKRGQSKAGDGDAEDGEGPQGDEEEEGGIVGGGLVGNSTGNGSVGPAKKGRGRGAKGAKAGVKEDAGLVENGIGNGSVGPARRGRGRGAKGAKAEALKDLLANELEDGGAENGAEEPGGNALAKGRARGGFSAGSIGQGRVGKGAGTAKGPKGVSATAVAGGAKPENGTAAQARKGKGQKRGRGKVEGGEAPPPAKRAKTANGKSTAVGPTGVGQVEGSKPKGRKAAATATAKAPKAELKATATKTGGRRR